MTQKIILKEIKKVKNLWKKENLRLDAGYCYDNKDKILKKVLIFHSKPSSTFFIGKTLRAIDELKESFSEYFSNIRKKVYKSAPKLYGYTKKQHQELMEREIDWKELLKAKIRNRKEIDSRSFFPYPTPSYPYPPYKSRKYKEDLNITRVTIEYENNEIFYLTGKNAELWRKWVMKAIVMAHWMGNFGYPIPIIKWKREKSKN